MVATPDRFKGGKQNMDAPATSAFSVTPDDNTDLASYTRAVWVGVTGDLQVIFIDDDDPVTIVAVPAGSLLPYRVKRVMAGATTADSIVGLL